MVCLSDKKEAAASVFKRLADFAVLLLIAALTGVACGAVGDVFAKSVGFADSLRAQYPWLIYILPFGGVASAALYRLTKTEGIGIKTVFECIRGKAKMPLLILPVIYAATVITHLFGGSAGKEGAALQLGSGIAEQASKITKSGTERKAVLTVCGMAAVFSAVFGTPAGACFFVLEIAFGGYINAAAVFPVFVSSIAAFAVSWALGAALSPFLGLSAELGAAIGMVAFFGGVTNCPIAAAVIGVELFGASGLWISAAAALVSKVFSGKVSLYNRQKFLSESFWLKKRIMSERA